jgi:hypothetical protein
VPIPKDSAKSLFPGLEQADKRDWPQEGKSRPHQKAVACLAPEGTLIRRRGKMIESELLPIMSGVLLGSPLAYLRQSLRLRVGGVAAV